MGLGQVVENKNVSSDADVLGNEGLEPPTSRM